MSEPREITAMVQELARLREQVEDLEDGKELDAAIQRNGNKLVVPWDEARRDLGLL